MKARNLLIVAVLTPLLVGCATKRDLQELRAEVSEMREAQEQQAAASQVRTREILEAIETNDRRLRGDLSNQFMEVEQQLVQIQELTGQGQQRISELRQQMAERGGATLAPRAGGPGAAARGADGTAEELFETSLTTLRRGSLATARAGFQDLLETYPNHRLAADAQFYIAESYAEAGDAERALDAYARVVDDYPDSPRIPTAFYRAGLIELELGNREDAEALFRQVVSGYPDSPEASLAEDRLDGRQ